MVIDVIYKQTIISVNTLDKTTAQDIINQSGILKLYPEINLNDNKIGVFGELIDLQYQVKPDDRIEIYRPISLDPMIKRFNTVALDRKNTRRNKWKIP